MKRSTAKMLLIVAFILLLVLVPVSLFVQSKALLIGSFVVWALLYIVLSFRLRCPSCGRPQGRGLLFRRYCPWCGESLDDES